MNNASEYIPLSVPALRVGLIGNPVAHSLSPRFQQAAFNLLGLPITYELWQTNPNDLAARVATLLEPQCLGANITIPYKEMILPLLDIVDPLASRIGAVNTVVHKDDYLHGYNTDAPGLLYALAEQGIGTLDEQNHLSLKDYTVILLGAGGAARGAAFALMSASVKRLIIVNRNLERAQRLASDVQQDSGVYPAFATPGEHSRRKKEKASPQVFSMSDPEFLIPHARSIIINATSAGMHMSGQEESETVSPLPAEILARFAPDTFVFDIIYNPRETYLLCQARALGLRAVNGLPMLLHQGALAFTLWTGQPAPLEIMRSTLL